MKLAGSVAAVSSCPGKNLTLKDFDPTDTGGYADKAAATQKLQQDIARLAELQDILSAQARYGLLIILEGVDASGKDSAIKHVMSGLNPQGVHVYSFKVPSQEERLHDYLWRNVKVLLERGRIGIFNRSYYEDVMVVRVHPEMLDEPDRQAAVEGRFWKMRYSQINAFEQYLTENRIIVLKFLLHISKKEQGRRLLKRLDDPTKEWKFTISDLQERRYWDEYTKSTDEMLQHTSAAFAPWYVLPADHKWVTRLLIADAVIAKLQSLDYRIHRSPRTFASISGPCGRSSSQVPG